jgi:hypothetical protein
MSKIRTVCIKKHIRIAGTKRVSRNAFIVYTHLNFN